VRRHAILPHGCGGEAKFLCDLNEKAGIFRVKPQAWHEPIPFAVAMAVAMPYDRFEARGPPRAGNRVYATD
jgi:hypothetical protein